MHAIDFANVGMTIATATCTSTPPKYIALSFARIAAFLARARKAISTEPNIAHAKEVSKCGCKSLVVHTHTLHLYTHKYYKIWNYRIVTDSTYWLVLACLSKCMAHVRSLWMWICTPHAQCMVRSKLQDFWESIHSGCLATFQNTPRLSSARLGIFGSRKKFWQMATWHKNLECIYFIDMQICHGNQLWMKLWLWRLLYIFCFFIKHQCGTLTYFQEVFPIFGTLCNRLPCLWQRIISQVVVIVFPVGQVCPCAAKRTRSRSTGHRIRTIRQWLHRKTWTCILQSNQFPSSKFALKDSRYVWRKKINIELRALESPTQVPIESPLLPPNTCQCHLSGSGVPVDGVKLRRRRGRRPRGRWGAAAQAWKENCRHGILIWFVQTGFKHILHYFAINLLYFSMKYTLDVLYNCVL